jgi:glycosyltransferase involved in cell wall biosynthesis
MKISVITVCFNSAATVADTLHSVGSQTHPDFEHIVIDGGSKDATLDIVSKHGPHVECIVSERDQGIYDAMNKGIRLATGDVIGLLNSDDFYASPQTLATVARVFDDPKVQACWGDLCYVKPDDTTKIVRYWRSSPFEPGQFERGWCPPHPTLFVRRKVYERFGGFDLRFSIGADVELMARFLAVKQIPCAYIPEVLVYMRMGGMSNRSLRNILRNNREIWRALRLHGLVVSPLSFFGGKLVSRGWQFLSRPLK